MPLNKTNYLIAACDAPTAVLLAMRRRVQLTIQQCRCTAGWYTMCVALADWRKLALSLQLEDK